MKGRGYRWPLLVVASLVGCAEANDSPIAGAPISAATWETYLAAASEADRIEDPVQRCLAYPDLPGNQWPEGSAKARCPLLRESTPTLAEIEATLAEADGTAQLERQFSALLDAHYANPEQREAIFLAFGGFGHSEAAEHVAKTWLLRAPKSAFAQTALGAVYLDRASRARGSQSVANTPNDQLQTMGRWLQQATPLLQAALLVEPRLSPACSHLMFIGRLTGDVALGGAATEHCLRVDPLSWNVRFQWQMSLDPRWRAVGRYEDPVMKLEESVEAIRPLVSQNPALGGMLARGIGMRAYLPILRGRPALETEEGLEAASRLAPDPLFIGSAGDAAAERGDFGKALGYFSQAIRLAPANTRFYGGRANARRKLGDLEGAIVDARMAIARDNSVGKYHSTLALSLSSLGRIQEARETYHDAMQYPFQRQWAFRRWCETYILGNLQPSEALACTRGLVNEYPEDAESHFMRSWVLYETASAGAEAAASRFHALADPRDKRHEEMKSELARLTGHGGRQ